VLKCALLFDQIEVILPLKSNKELTRVQWAKQASSLEFDEFYDPRE
jgi:hypothetical protein